ncbi:MAG: SMP-30/gluconolactonase/LRE family protein [Gammaproteobacteria bacterium]|nr:SMP-30/gluconolactonase/LRE family protein [Gammaproteobacteria bacterium]MYD03176.1 SMP-30/gluconolactonase/LRE family protein [Gammaproteobacteria bacterium]MYI25799.1 SMP-30/gluconolactonase/LRE family protein [Gammaproteobacteria bacterium]
MGTDAARRRDSADLDNVREGDLFLVLNEIDQDHIDYRKGISGQCRIVHYDRDFNARGELWTGEAGMLVGLLYNPNDRRLYATNPQLNSILAYDASGGQHRLDAFLPERRYGNMALARNGDILVGVHSLYGESIEDEHGDGKLIRFNPQTRTVSFHDVEIDGGRGGRHCVSNLALGADDRTVYYVSEAGRRLCRYDTESRRQLSDFVTFGEDAAMRTYGLGMLPGGEVLMASGSGAVLFGPRGELLKSYEVPLENGWTRAKPALDGEHFYLSNFLHGLLQRRDIATGEVVSELNTGLKCSLLSLSEYRAGNTSESMPVRGG